MKSLLLAFAVGMVSVQAEAQVASSTSALARNPPLGSFIDTTDNGFIVSSAWWREAYEAWSVEPLYRAELGELRTEARYLRSAVVHEVRAKESAQERVQTWEGAAREAEAKAAANAERSVFEHPLLWVAVGVVGSLGIAALANTLRSDAVVLRSQ